MPEENIHPVADKLLDRPTKELSLGSSRWCLAVRAFRFSKHCKRWNSL